MADKTVIDSISDHTFLWRSIFIIGGLILSVIGSLFAMMWKSWRNFKDDANKRLDRMEKRVDGTYELIEKETSERIRDLDDKREENSQRITVVEGNVKTIEKVCEERHGKK